MPRRADGVSSTIIMSSTSSGCFPVDGRGREHLLAAFARCSRGVCSRVEPGRGRRRSASHGRAGALRASRRRPRGGVATAHIADRLEMGDTLPVYVQDNPHFRLPDDDVPIIMIGPGTGVAPYPRLPAGARSSAPPRVDRGSSSASATSAATSSTRSNGRQWLKDGVLTPARRRIFARHRRRRSMSSTACCEQGARPLRLARRGRPFLRLRRREGDGARRARALIEIVEREGGHSREAAEDYVRAARRRAPLPARRLLSRPMATRTIDRSADLSQPLDKLGPDETLKFKSDYLRGNDRARTARSDHRRQ